MQATSGRAKSSTAAICGKGSFLCFLVALIAATAGCGEAKPSKNFSIVELNPSAGDLPSMLKAEVKKAREAGQKPFMEVYADWCRPCVALRKSLNDARMIDAFDGTYIIQVDGDAWRSALSGPGFPVNEIPVFLELNEEGKPTGRSITSNAWKANTPAEMAPPLKRFFNG
jgi:hypothetical protein